MDIKAELLLTKAETDAIIVENASVYSGDCMDAVLKAQATKAVEMILSRIKELEVHDSYSYRLVGYRISVEELNDFERELLDKIGGEK